LSKSMKAYLSGTGIKRAT